MNTRTVRLIDPARTVVAVATVTDEGDHFAGSIDLSTTPPAVVAVFREFEEIVNEQMFSFLDEVQAKVMALGLRAEWDGGNLAQLKDLQIYPTQGEVSFKLASVPAMKTPA